MKILITYQSKTGFTKKYADWISNKLNADIEDIKGISINKISEYDLVIHGGWIMGGMIMGLDKIKKLSPKKLIVFGVGYTPKEEVNISQMKVANKIENIPFFYYQGGLNPEKMGFFSKAIVKMVTKEKMVYKDNTNEKDINDLIKEVKKGD